jgi:UDP-N-acetylmuramoyl-L-alanyl-D-glutamate--2,6-diaminopimelate ligase
VSTVTTLHTPQQAVDWLRQRVRGELRVDSRQVGPGDGFIAWPGAATDGRRFCAQALAAGAAACLVEHEGLDAWGLTGDSIASYPQLKSATGPIAAAYYGNPTDAIDLLAVTGTNGKTSSTWWIAQALQNIEHQTRIQCAVIGTLGTGIAPHLDYNGLTTPDPVLLQHQLRRFADLGVRYCAIEASSIGVAERRLDGAKVRVAVFTNLTHDHLDYHGDMAHYWQAKAALFQWPGLRAAVVNVDDPQGMVLTDSLQGSGLDLWTVGTDAAFRPRLLASSVRYAAHAKGFGLCFDVSEGEQTFTLETQLIGHYNVSNVLGVLGVLRALGHSLQAAVKTCAVVTPVPGRMECMGGAGEPMVVVDYAHTPDALDKALTGLRPLVQERGGQLWCVFGCGGARDASKRPAMAAIAERNADQVVVTSDNPRTEKPEAIISQILLGLSHSAQRADRLHVQTLRAEAIRYALHTATAKDVVLLAGKGSEDYQEIEGVRHHFSDREQALAALASRGAST